MVRCREGGGGEWDGKESWRLAGSRAGEGWGGGGKGGEQDELS
jgi:hypothetical protein